jgi:hypothetical protein
MLCLLERFCLFHSFLKDFVCKFSFSAMTLLFQKLHCCCWDTHHQPIHYSLFFYLFIFVVPGLDLRAYTLSHSTSLFCTRYFWDRFSWTICSSWHQTMILLISASWVAMSTGKSHQHLHSLEIILFFSLYAF